MARSGVDSTRAIARSCALASLFAIGCGQAGSGSDVRDPATAGGTEPAGGGTQDDGDGDGGGSGGDDGGVDDDTGSGEDPTSGSLGDALHVELAGHSMTGSPWFRAVASFADHETIEVAIDPRRFPELDGSACDLYIVAARDVAAWDADPMLVDVRPGGAQAIAIAGEIADNRMQIAAPGELSADAGLGFGVAYDVVLDCNGNGQLDEGDVLDGGERPGLYRTSDPTLFGPLAVSLVEVPTGSMLGKRVFHPADIARMDPLPLVVVTHGWSYTYEHYDYIGEHLASWGYVVMVHEADVQDGGPSATHAAATTTLENTDDLLSNLQVIGGGILDGRIDTHRLMFTGHSTGGEAVVRALTQLRDGSFSSPHFGVDDVRIVSSMAPVSWHPRTLVDPGDVAYHMFLAGADDDVSGAPIPSYTQPRSIYERAAGPRQLTYIHGAGHGDLVGCCGPAFLDTSAPDLIGRAETNVVMRGTFLALAELYLKDNEAAEELLSRPYPDHHPASIADGVVVTREYHDARAKVFVLDDFESSPGAGDDPRVVSSSGAAVDFDVTNAIEVLMQDNDGSLAWTGSQPSNGMTHARHPGDSPHAFVFDYTSGADWFFEEEVPAEARDFRVVDVLSFRACQGTRHPETVALDGPLTFTVTLRDEAGASASIPLAGLAEIPPPYARMGEGAGVGWQNELTTVRLRITDFLGDNPALDLAHIEAVRFDFGESHGSPRGRLGLDDLELVLR